MLFVNSGKDAAARLARSKSALDLLIANTRSLARQLSSHDQETLKQYLDAEPKEAQLYFQTMYELIYLAFLSDSTRVATFQLARLFIRRSQIL